MPDARVDFGAAGIRNGHATEDRVFFIFRFTDPLDPFFWKLKKRETFFNFILFPPTHASTILEFIYVFLVLSFLLLPG